MKFVGTDSFLHWNRWFYLFKVCLRLHCVYESSVHCSHCQALTCIEQANLTYKIYGLLTILLWHYVPENNLCSQNIYAVSKKLVVGFYLVCMWNWNWKCIGYRKLSLRCIFYNLKWPVWVIFCCTFNWKFDCWFFFFSVLRIYE